MAPDPRTLRLLAGLSLALLAVGASACSDDRGFSYLRGNTIAITVGDFDNVQQPFNRLVLDTARYEGLISSPTWAEDEWDYVPPALSVEELFLSEQNNEIRNHRIVIVASGTRGFGKRQYNSLQPDDHLVTDDQVATNIQAYVNGGGQIWFTDWTYDIIPRVFPDAVTFLGDDAELDAAQRGDIGVVQSQIVDSQLRDALETEQLTVAMNYSNWAVPESVLDSGRVRVFLTGNATYRATEGGGTQAVADAPLLFSIRSGEQGGQLIFSSFHIDAQNPVIMDTIMTTILGRIDQQVSVRETGEL